MTEPTTDNGENGSASGFKPPYGSFSTLNKLFDRMTDENVVPARIDRSYLSNLPNSVIATTTQALKALDLADANLVPTPLLVEIVENPEQRKSLLAGIIKDKYAAQLALGPNATTQQLEKSFREMGATGSTVRKAIAFFLAAAKHAEVPYSRFFKTPKAPAPSGERRQRRQLSETNGGNDNPPPPPPPPDELAGLDPFIVGLVRRLPPADSVFSADKQEAWFETARGIFRLIYKTGADERPPDSFDEGAGRA